jgi:hypothetical protein
MDEVIVPMFLIFGIAAIFGNKLTKWNDED